MIALRFGVGDPDWHVYRVAGCRIAADVRIPALEAFPADGARTAAFEPPASPPAIDRSTLVHRGTGWIAGRDRMVECRSAPEGYRLTVAGVGTLDVAADGSAIAWRLGLAPPSDHAAALPWPAVETTLGPALALALAAHGVFCLHAGAVERQGLVVALVGESGRGKSTLAAFMGASRGWLQLADDVLPVMASEESGPVGLPHFPQLKLAPDAQVSVDSPERRPLEAVYVIHRPAGADREVGGDGPVASFVSPPLGTRAAMLALVRHTVGARLFGRALSAAHMRFCAEAAANVPVRRAVYALRPESLPQLRDLIGRDIAVQRQA